MSRWRRRGATKIDNTRQTKPEPPRAPNAWDVIALLMEINPPPVDGRDWLAGHNDGLFLAQCQLKGAAQGLAMQGRFVEAVAVAKQAVSLNDIRITPSPTKH